MRKKTWRTMKLVRAKTRRRRQLRIILRMFTEVQMGTSDKYLTNVIQNPFLF